MNGIPKVFHYGLAEKKYNALVLELLGPSLEDLFNICNRKFTLKTIMMIGIHTVRDIQLYHDNHARHFYAAANIITILQIHASRIVFHKNQLF
jgi:hypothetical protein